MQGWHYGKGLSYLMANISANKICLSQGQSKTEGKYYNGSYFFFFAEKKAEPL